MLLPRLSLAATGLPLLTYGASVSSSTHSSRTSCCAGRTARPKSQRRHRVHLRRPLSHSCSLPAPLLLSSSPTSQDRSFLSPPLPSLPIGFLALYHQPPLSRAPRPPAGSPVFQFPPLLPVILVSRLSTPLRTAFVLFLPVSKFPLEPYPSLLGARGSPREFPSVGMATCTWSPGRRYPHRCLRSQRCASSIFCFLIAQVACSYPSSVKA